MEAKVEAPPARGGTEGDEEEVEDPGKTLARFEASVDMSNPQQVKVSHGHEERCLRGLRFLALSTVPPTNRLTDSSHLALFFLAGA